MPRVAAYHGCCMGMTPTYALAHVFLPNWLKLKGHATVMSAFERRDLAYFEPLWAQAGLQHKPYITTQLREGNNLTFQVATVTFPPPKEMGEAHMAGIVIKKGDPSFVRYYTLEHDFVLKSKSDRTVLAERDGQKHSRRGDGPVLTGNPETDAKAFVDCFMEQLIPTKVTRY